MSKATPEQVELLELLADEMGTRLKNDYSGRGMYGKTCYAMTVDDPDAVKEQAYSYGLPRPMTDNMGLRYVCYWPGFETEVEENDEE